MNMMGLDEILNELKGLNELMIQERFLMKLERDRTQTLLQWMQCVINRPVPPLLPKANSSVVPTGVTTPPGFLAPESINTNARTGNVSTPVMLDQERFLMEQESYQAQLLLFSKQNLINTFNGNRTQPCLLNPNFPVVPPPPNAYSAEVPQPKFGNRTPTGVTTPSARFLVPKSIIDDATTITTTQKTPNVLSAPSSINAENGNFSTYVMMSVSNRKRKDTEEMDATSIGKKSRGRSSSGKIPVQDQNTLPQPNNVVYKQTVPKILSFSVFQTLFVQSMANLADQRLLALIVDSYLRENNFSKTRTSFRNEAPFLFNDSPKYNQMSMNMMGLDEILNELKGLNELMIQERFLMKLERDRTQTLLQCMQCVINFYYDRTLPITNRPLLPLLPKANSSVVPTGVNTITTPPARFLGPQSINTDTTTGNISTPVGVFDKPVLNEISTHESDNDLQADLPHIDDDLETFGPIFNDPDSPWEGVDFSDYPTPNQLKDNASGPSRECKSQQVISELPSTAAKVLSEKERYECTRPRFSDCNEIIQK